MIKIGDIDIGKTIIELQFQTKLNSLLIEKMMNNEPLSSQKELEQLKVAAAAAVNEYYGKEMITYTPKNK